MRSTARCAERCLRSIPAAGLRRSASRTGGAVLATADASPFRGQARRHSRRRTRGCRRRAGRARRPRVPPLRRHLTAGRFWSLLPVVHFLKRITRGIWPAPLVAERGGCIVIDDPNVRWLILRVCEFPGSRPDDAWDCGYHGVVVTIPLHPGHARPPGSRRLPRVRRTPLACFHGNDHVHRELVLPHSVCEADRMIHSATTPVARFERRVGNPAWERAHVPATRSLRCVHPGRPLPPRFPRPCGVPAVPVGCVRRPAPLAPGRLGCRRSSPGGGLPVVPRYLLNLYLN